MKHNLTTMTALCLLLAGLLLPVGTKAQSCKETIAATSPQSAFTLRGDGTAIHRSTGLMWMRCSLGQTWNGRTCRGEAATYTWGGAFQAADQYEFAGFTDWRLPNKNELDSLFEESCSSPSINKQIFPATPSAYFWSSSPYCGLANGAWSMDFCYGSVNASDKSGSLYVRLVRGGN